MREIGGGLLRDVYKRRCRKEVSKKMKMVYKKGLIFLFVLFSFFFSGPSKVVKGLGCLDAADVGEVGV